MPSRNPLYYRQLAAKIWRCGGFTVTSSALTKSRTKAKIHWRKMGCAESGHFKFANSGAVPHKICPILEQTSWHVWFGKAPLVWRGRTTLRQPTPEHKIKMVWRSPCFHPTPKVLAPKRFPGVNTWWISEIPSNIGHLFTFCHLRKTENSGKRVELPQRATWFQTSEYSCTNIVWMKRTAWYQHITLRHIKTKT